MNTFFINEVLPRIILCIIMIVACAIAIINLYEREPGEPMLLFLLRNGLAGVIFGTICGNILGYYFNHG